MRKLRVKLIGALLFAAVLNISAEGAALNAVCTFHPGKEALRRSDYEAWLRSGVVDCRQSGEPASILIIPAPDAVDAWSEASVAANLCDFTKSIAIIPARSIHAVSSRNQTHITEANSVIVCGSKPRRRHEAGALHSKHVAGGSMHFAISATYGPTDPTRAMLPFIFASSALQAGDSVTLMLFHDAVLMAIEGAGGKLVPVGPPNRYEEVASNPNVTLYACRPCVDARGLPAASLDRRVKLAGMNEFHAAAREPSSKVVGF